MGEPTKKHVSILKPQRLRNASGDTDLTETCIETTPPRANKRVSFKRSSSVKPFISHLDDKYTIWDTTYEEEVNHTDSTHSSQETTQHASQRVGVDTARGQSDLNTTAFLNEEDNEDAEKDIIGQEVSGGTSIWKLGQTLCHSESVELTRAIPHDNISAHNANRTLLSNSNMNLTMLPAIVDKENMNPFGIVELKNKVSILTFAKRSKISSRIPDENNFSRLINATKCFNTSSGGSDMEFTGVMQQDIYKNNSKFKSGEYLDVNNLNPYDADLNEVPMETSVCNDNTLEEGIISSNMLRLPVSQVNLSECINNKIPEPGTVSAGFEPHCNTTQEMEFTCQIPAKILQNEDSKNNLLYYATDKMQELETRNTAFKSFSNTNREMELTCQIPGDIAASLSCTKDQIQEFNTQSAPHRSSSGTTQEMEFACQIPEQILQSKDCHTTNVNASKSFCNKSEEMEFTCRIPENILQNEDGLAVSLNCTNDQIRAFNTHSAASRSSLGTTQEMEFTCQIPRQILQNRDCHTANVNASKSFCNKSHEMEFTCLIPSSQNKGSLAASLRCTEDQIEDFNTPSAAPRSFSETSHEMEFTCQIPGKILQSKDYHMASVNASKSFCNASQEMEFTCRIPGKDGIAASLSCTKDQIKEFNTHSAPSRSSHGTNQEMEFTCQIPATILQSKEWDITNVNAPKSSCNRSQGMEFTSPIPEKILQNEDGIAAALNCTNDQIHAFNTKSAVTTSSSKISQEMELTSQMPGKTNYDYQIGSTKPLNKTKHFNTSSKGFEMEFTGVVPQQFYDNSSKCMITDNHTRVSDVDSNEVRMETSYCSNSASEKLLHEHSHNILFSKITPTSSIESFTKKGSGFKSVGNSSQEMQFTCQIPAKVSQSKGCLITVDNQFGNIRLPNDNNFNTLQGEHDMKFTGDVENQNILDGPQLQEVPMEISACSDNNPNTLSNTSYKMEATCQIPEKVVQNKDWRMTLDSMSPCTDNTQQLINFHLNSSFDLPKANASGLPLPEIVDKSTTQERDSTRNNETKNVFLDGTQKNIVKGLVIEENNDVKVNQKCNTSKTPAVDNTSFEICALIDIEQTTHEICQSIDTNIMKTSDKGHDMFVDMKEIQGEEDIKEILKEKNNSKTLVENQTKKVVLETSVRCDNIVREFVEDQSISKQNKGVKMGQLTSKTNDKESTKSDVKDDNQLSSHASKKIKVQIEDHPLDTNDQVIFINDNICLDGKSKETKETGSSIKTNTTFVKDQSSLIGKVVQEVEKVGIDFSSNDKSDPLKTFVKDHNRLDGNTKGDGEDRNNCIDLDPKNIGDPSRTFVKDHTSFINTLQRNLKEETDSTVCNANDENHHSNTFVKDRPSVMTSVTKIVIENYVNESMDSREQKLVISKEAITFKNNGSFNGSVGDSIERMSNTLDSNSKNISQESFIVLDTSESDVIMHEDSSDSLNLREDQIFNKQEVQEMKNLMDSIRPEIYTFKMPDIELNTADFAERFERIHKQNVNIYTKFKIEPIEITNLEAKNSQELGDSNEDLEILNCENKDPSHVSFLEQEIPSRPLSMLEKILAMEERCKPYWIFEKEEDGAFHFSTLYRTLKLIVRFNIEGTVCDIKMINNLAEDVEHLPKYVLKLFMETLETKHLEAALGMSFDVLSFLDYVYLTMQNMINFLSDAKEMDMEMRSMNIMTYRVVNFDLILNWLVTVDVTDLRNIGPDNVNLQVRTQGTPEDVIQTYQKTVKRLVNNCPKNLGFFKCFREKIDEYIGVLKKRTRLKKVDNLS